MRTIKIIEQVGQQKSNACTLESIRVAEHLLNPTPSASTREKLEESIIGARKTYAEYLKKYPDAGAGFTAEEAIQYSTLLALDFKETRIALPQDPEKIREVLRGFIKQYKSQSTGDVDLLPITTDAILSILGEGEEQIAFIVGLSTSEDDNDTLLAQAMQIFNTNNPVPDQPVLIDIPTGTAILLMDGVHTTSITHVGNQYFHFDPNTAELEIYHETEFGLLMQRRLSKHGLTIRHLNSTPELIAAAFPVAQAAAAAPVMQLSTAVLKNEMFQLLDTMPKSPFKIICQKIYNKYTGQESHAFLEILRPIVPQSLQAESGHDMLLEQLTWLVYGKTNIPPSESEKKILQLLYAMHDRTRLSPAQQAKKQARVAPAPASSASSASSASAASAASKEMLLHAYSQPPVPAATAAAATTQVAETNKKKMQRLLNALPQSEFKSMCEKIYAQYDNQKNVLFLCILAPITEQAADNSLEYLQLYSNNPAEQKMMELFHDLAADPEAASQFQQKSISH